MSRPLYQILLKPLLTEKSVTLAKSKKYLFKVAIDATKIEIAQAVEEMFVKDKIRVAEVNTMHVRGKERRMNLRKGRRASVGTTPNWKKAIVTLEADSPNIPLLEGV